MNRAAAHPQIEASAEATLTASRAMLGIVARSLGEALEMVTLPQFRVLVILSGSSPLRMGALAARVNAVPSTFSRSIDRMVAGEWVRRIESPENRREVLIELTPRGERLVSRVTEHRRKELAEILDRLSDHDRRSVEEAFAAFARAAGEPSADALLALGI